MYMYMYKNMYQQHKHHFECRYLQAKSSDQQDSNAKYPNRCHIVHTRLGARYQHKLRYTEPQVIICTVNVYCKWRPNFPPFADQSECRGEGMERWRGSVEEGPSPPSISPRCAHWQIAYSLVPDKGCQCRVEAAMS